MRKAIRSSALLVLCLALASSAFAKAKITIKNTDTAGVGFNDTTPIKPAGGNPGTTLGDARLNAFQEAARIWGETIDSDVEIIIDASFAPLSCTANSATLGSAGPTNLFSDFPNAPKSNTWYVSALANKIAGRDLHQDPDQCPQCGAAHIRARFNGDLDKDSCLGTTGWYYGLDGNHGSDIDLVVVLLHEFAHGLGVVGSVTIPGSEDNTHPAGSLRFDGMPTVYDLHAKDDAVGLRIDQMSDAQRAAAMVNDQNLVWDGDLVHAAADKLLKAVPNMSIGAPASIAKTYVLGYANFGPQAPVAGITANIVAATDVAEPASSGLVAGTTTDGCSAYTNAAAVPGRIVLVDRNRCKFAEKAKIAQDAGALALLVVDNLDGVSTPSIMAGSGDATLDASIHIPVVCVTKAEGTAIRAALGAGVSATIFADITRRAGADKDGLVKLYAPTTAAAGSTYSHWDVSAFPNLLMEPNINSDLKHEVDITIDMLNDIGWNFGVSSNPTQPAPPTPTNGGFNGRRFGKR